MALTNTHTRYGSVARSFHWLTALLILTLIPVAVIANQLPYDTSEQLARKAWLFSLHKTLGVTVFFVALLRILWAIVQPKPAPLHPHNKTETFLAETAHWLLYGSLVLAPLSGWIHHAATAGFAPIWWPLGQNLPLVPKSDSFAALSGGAHWVFGKVMAAAILAHVAGALKHQIIDRDATLRRMLNGAPELAALSPARHSALPLGAAIAIWAVVLAAGSVFGIYKPHASTAQAAELSQVASEWEVQSGSIALTVTQFGGLVTGQFADWTADIDFDPQIMGAQAGTVEVVIATGSLTLGSVTSQALAPDFFNAAAFDTATYTADLYTLNDQFVARGALQLKGVSVPFEMPFRLSIDDGVAVMSAQTTLDRRDFGIGDNLPDEDAVNFAVQVDINLTATQPE